MAYQNLSEKVEAILDDCNTSELPLIDGGKDKKPVVYNQRATLRRINFYINNRYLDRDDDGAIFWNITNPRITHFTKLISPDTKDFYPYGLGEHNFIQAWALKKKVKEFFKDTAFYQTLNDVGEGLATYGSCVWKKYNDDGKKKVKEVKLENLYFDQSVENIKDADVVEIHNLSKKDLYDKEEVWDNVREVLKKKEDEGRYEIWEYYGLWADNDDDEPVYRHEIGYGYGTEYVCLWSEDITREECPYEDFHLGRYRGRWLRIGVPERLFDLQVRTNKLVYENALTTEISSLLLLKSANADSVGNILERAIQGQIISDESLEQVLLQNPGLSQFFNEMNMINAQADRLCLTPEIVQGESSPSNTTFRGIAVMNAGAVSAFKNYRQNLFEKIAEILLRDIFPPLVKGWKREEMLEMAEDDEDVEAYDKAVVEYMKKDTLLGGVTITPEIEAQIQGSVADNIKKVGRRVEIDKDFFDFKWGFKMMPTDESVDKNAMNDTYFNALQMTMTNPAITEVPGFKQYLEDNGISPWKLTPKQQEQLQQQPGQQMPEQKKPDKLLAEAQQIK
jgi:hypothetical protein